MKTWEEQPLLLYTDYPKNETFAGKEPQKQNTTLSVLDVEGAFSVKYLLTHFQHSINSVILENFSIEIKSPYLLPPISEYVYSKEIHSMLYFHH